MTAIFFIEKFAKRFLIILTLMIWQKISSNRMGNGKGPILGQPSPRFWANVFFAKSENGVCPKIWKLPNVWAHHILKFGPIWSTGSWATAILSRKIRFSRDFYFEKKFSWGSMGTPWGPPIWVPKDFPELSCIWNCGRFLPPGSWSMNPSFAETEFR